MLHSIEAEECLLSCCLLDGADILSKCQAAGIGPASFYEPKNGIVYEGLTRLQKRTVANIDLALLAEALKADGKLDALGGYGFLTQVTSKVPTTVQAAFYIERVSALAKSRAAAALIAKVKDDLGKPDFRQTAAEASRAFAELAADEARPTEMGWDAILKFDPDDDPDCLMGHRFLGRSGACVFVAPSGVGKSVLALQFGACAALGKPFFGMKIHAQMRVLYVQAEDDLGDVSEAVRGFLGGMKVSPAELTTLRKNLRIERWNDVAGDKFLARLRAAHTKRPFDLVIINPLFSFSGCNVSDQSEMSAFLRNGLQPILNDTGALASLVHHTGKPSDDPDAPEKDHSYAGFGSSELTNWARAIITLNRVKAAGGEVYKMNFAKRGKRAGLVSEEGEPITSVMIQHSREGLFWTPSEYVPEKGSGGKFKAKFSLEVARSAFVRGDKWSENEKRIAETLGMSTRAVRSHKQELEAA